MIYRYDGDGNLDIFNLTVKVKDAYLDVSIRVQVSSEGRQRSTPILHSRSLIVEEGKPVKLSRGKLQVSDSQSLELSYWLRLVGAYNPFVCF